MPPRDDEDGEIAALLGDRSPGLRLSYIISASCAQENFGVSERVRCTAEPRLNVGRVELGVRLHAPSASLRTINSTGIRVPRITGFPSRHCTCTYNALTTRTTNSTHDVSY